MNVYNKNGYKNRNEYLESIAYELDIEPETVRMIADMLGPGEDFDGLIAMLEEMNMEW